MLERWEELSFSVKNKEGGGGGGGSGFSTPTPLCVCVSPFRGCSTPTSFSHICVGGKNFFFFFSFFIMSFFLFDIYFDSPCVVVAVVFPSVGFFFLLFLPFAEGAPSSIHRPACYRTNTCVTSFQMVWWGDIFFSSFLATPLVAERSKDSKR